MKLFEGSNLVSFFNSCFLIYYVLMRCLNFQSFGIYTHKMCELSKFCFHLEKSLVCFFCILLR